MDEFKEYTVTVRRVMLETIKVLCTDPDGAREHALRGNGQRTLRVEESAEVLEVKPS